MVYTQCHKLGIHHMAFFFFVFGLVPSKLPEISSVEYIFRSAWTPCLFVANIWVWSTCFKSFFKMVGASVLYSMHSANQYTHIYWCCSSKVNHSRHFRQYASSPIFIKCNVVIMWCCTGSVIHQSPSTVGQQRAGPLWNVMRECDAV